MKMTLFLMAAISCGAMEHDHMAMHGMYGSYSMEQDATGTSWVPASTQMPGIHRNPDEWLLMVHGFLMAVYDDQGGPRGGRKFFSENMFMFSPHRAGALPFDDNNMPLLNNIHRLSRT